MINLKARNREVKKRLSAVFGSQNVSVTGGRGTARGWCDIYINGGKRLSDADFYTQEEMNVMNSIHDKAESLLEGVEFYGYTDDMDTKHQEVIIQVNLTGG